MLWIHRHVLRFRLGPSTAADHAIGWQILHSDAEQFVLTTDGSLMRGQLTLCRQADRYAVPTTQLFFRHRATARVVWAVIGPMHRAIAPRLIERSARRTHGSPLVRRTPTGVTAQPGKEFRLHVAPVIHRDGSAEHPGSAQRVMITR